MVVRMMCALLRVIKTWHQQQHNQRVTQRHFHQRPIQRVTQRHHQQQHQQRVTQRQAQTAMPRSVLPVQVFVQMGMALGAPQLLMPMWDVKVALVIMRVWEPQVPLEM